MPPTPIPNPSTCCGVTVSCCPKPLPDILSAQVITDCGTYNGQIELSLITGPGSAVWEGKVPGVQCIPSPAPGTPCTDFDGTVSLLCSGGVFDMHLAGYSNVPDAGSTCGPPLDLTLTIPPFSASPSCNMNVVLKIKG